MTPPSGSRGNRLSGAVGAGLSSGWGIRLGQGEAPGVVVVEGIWPNDRFIEGIGINVLTGADPGPPFGGAVFHDTAVWLKGE